MCATVNKYESKIEKLQHVIYPQIVDAIDETLCFINIHNYDGLEENLTKLQDELNSLVHIESKLVFPVIISVFKENFDHHYFPNIKEIIQLTTSKEVKISSYLYNIKQITEIDESNLKDEFEVQLKKVFRLFDFSYFPVKKRWISLLQMLTPESVQCENRNNGNCKCGTHEQEKNSIHHHH